MGLMTADGRINRERRVDEVDDVDDDDEVEEDLSLPEGKVGTEKEKPATCDLPEKSGLTLSVFCKCESGADEGRGKRSAAK